MKYDTLQGVSKFDRQTFRADSTIKNKHKTLNTYGVKNAWFARNQQKRTNSYDLNSWILWGYLCIEQGGDILTIFVNCT
jgi:hypothetical protein